MHFIPEEIEEYVLQHSQKEPELLQELNRETNQKILQPRMLSGHYQGRLLSMISKLVKPATVLEIGTYTGYSALCIAEGLAPDGKIHTIDKNEELVELQKKYFEKSPYNYHIEQYTGDATQIIPKLEMNFDLVFIDADKPNYAVYFNLIIDKLNHGGILLSDNVLWSGKVVQKDAENDESTEALIRYNKLLAEDSRLETIILPIRDGLTISRKL
ncbi:MAG TPA: O-methyltransferase [Salinimicrobium sp.]|nr:O-methyltransferase [Salinimicrobium sp.]